MADPQQATDDAYFISTNHQTIDETCLPEPKLVIEINVAHSAYHVALRHPSSVPAKRKGNSTSHTHVLATNINETMANPI